MLASFDARVRFAHLQSAVFEQTGSADRRSADRPRRGAPSALGARSMTDDDPQRTSGPTDTGSMGRWRNRARIRGVFRGVGFRPQVCRFVTSSGLAGWVLNDAPEVLLEVEGAPADVARCLERLPAEAPPLASVDAVTTKERAREDVEGLSIVGSDDSEPPEALGAPDRPTCEGIGDSNPLSGRKRRWDGGHGPGNGAGRGAGGCLGRWPAR